MEIVNEVLALLQNWTNVTTVGGCLIFGSILNNYVDMDNKHIPLIMAVSGVVISVALNGFIDFETTILAGALSGLASTGLHQVFHQYIKGNQEEKEIDFLGGNDQ